MGAAPHIGTLGEKPLHAALKRWYARPGDDMEVQVDAFVIDLVRGELLIEIQTRGFRFMKQKVRRLLDLGHRIRIVHPIAAENSIVRLDGEGEVISRRRSPKHGIPADLFTELVSFPGLLAHPQLEIDLVLTSEEERREHTPGRSWRRKGWSVLERRLVEVLEARLVRDPDDLVALLPTDLPESFTTAELAAAMGRSRRVAQQAAYCLREAGGIIAVGKRGNAVEYRLAGSTIVWIGPRSHPSTSLDHSC